MIAIKSRDPGSPAGRRKSACDTIRWRHPKAPAGGPHPEFGRKEFGLKLFNFFDKQKWVEKRYEPATQKRTRDGKKDLLSAKRCGSRWDLDSSIGLDSRDRSVSSPPAMVACQLRCHWRWQRQH
jgi:hypothetical protein